MDEPGSFAEQELTDPQNVATLTEAARRTMVPQAISLLSEYAQLADQIQFAPHQQSGLGTPDLSREIAAMRKQIQRLPEAMGEYLSAPPEEAYLKLAAYRQAAKQLAEQPEYHRRTNRGAADYGHVVRRLNELGVELHDLANPNNLLT